MKIPIALLVTDTHLSEHNINLVTNIWKQAIDKCHELGIDQIFFGGDFFHSRKGQPLTTLKAAQRIVELLEDSGIVVDGICGNHDKQDYDSEDSYMDILKSNSFEIYRDWGSMDFENVEVYFLPYFKESGSYLERLNRILASKNSVKKQILITHIAINGSIANDNQHISNCIPSKGFAKFDTILTGHFHNRQEFENIVYFGSAYQSNYGEDNNKGFTILYDDGSYEFTRTIFPEYRKYTLNYQNLGETEIKELLVEKQSGHNIRLELTGEPEKLKSFNRSFVTDLGIECVLKSSEPLGSMNNNETIQAVTYDKKSLSEAFIDFCKENKVEDTEYGIKKMELI